ncbi:histidyl-tRNA synthetase [Polynucleobacter kasalickyi]|uniref:Histidine--tRNA ligase n=2 Tax=Polynucleobacter kasalickyi TaxID=1938817 RepID=A0A1W2B1Q4_9BURK|nr:histidyl-tRNA synthetase [Polynucleobacter kasalickyi]
MSDLIPNAPEPIKKAPVKISKLVGVKGMNDLLPPDSYIWEKLERSLIGLAKTYGYQNIRTPILEHTGVFLRGIGEVTDIVEKEMYSFEDRLNGEQLTLRPEGTAAVVRACVENNLLYDGPRRLYYIGPMFRHERPQRGRYRQFHQFGIEALGFAGPEIDAEIILMCQRLWDDLGISGLRLEINSLGNESERLAHRQALVTYFESNISLLDEDSVRRLKLNPLRILDTKNPSMQELVELAPQLINFLGEESLAHFEQLQQILKANNIVFKINPRLVRGLDYYNLTVFEWITDQLGAQGTVAGGGRYDPLIERMGGKPAPACGWAMGIERIVELMKEQGLTDEQTTQCDVYVVHSGGKTIIPAMVGAEVLRSAGVDVMVHASPDGKVSSFKSQMKKADASGALFALIIGENELEANSFLLKDLRRSGNQSSYPMEELLDQVIDAIVSEND